MVKGKNLMGGFDVSVSTADLTGPAKLPDYLDSDPVQTIRELESRQVKEVQKISPPKEKPSLVKPVEREPAMDPTFETKPVVKRQKSLSKPQTRLQINMTNEIQNKTAELIKLISSQRDENEVKITEIVHAMVLELYAAKDDIDLSSIPLRGRWGSQTAKSFAPALGQAFREAIANRYLREGGNQFKKAVGG